LLLIANLILLSAVAKEALKTRLLGKFFLVASCLIFFWVDAFDLSRQEVAFAVPRGLPVSSQQFDQRLLQDGFFYVALFQLMLLVGYSVRPRLNTWATWIGRRLDTTHRLHRLLIYVFVACALLPFLMTYDFNLKVALDAVLAARSEARETQDIGLLLLLSYFGMFGASLLLVESFVTKGLKRVGTLAVATIAVLPYVYGGTRHLLLYISLPLIIIFPRLFTRKWNTTRLGAATFIMIMLMTVFQLQITLRDVGWSNIRAVPIDSFAQANTNGQFGALLFAEYLVPDTHDYFMEPAEVYFLIQWIPRKFWPEKPVMRSWDYYNYAYTQGWEFNVTPSVIGQYYMSWGVLGIVGIGIWLGFLTQLADKWIAILKVRDQRAMVVVVGMFYAFIISSFRFYSPIYFAYFVFAFVSMCLMTARKKEKRLEIPQLLPAQLLRRPF